jgi:hypothetical protein
MPREEFDEGLVAPQGIFLEGTKGDSLKEKRCSRRTATGESWSGNVEFISPPRGYCITAESLDDALAWLAIEGSRSKCEGLFRFSASSLPLRQVSETEGHWVGVLKQIFAQ